MKKYGPSSMRPKSAGAGDGGARLNNGSGDYGFKSGPELGDSPTPTADFQRTHDCCSGTAKGNSPVKEGAS